VEDSGTTGISPQDTTDCLLGDPAHLNPSSSCLPPGNIEDLWLQDTIHLRELKTTAEFVKVLQSATLDNPSMGMSDEALHHLWNPPHDQSPVVVDKVTQLAIDLYLGNPLEVTYETNCKAILRFLSDVELPSYYKIKHSVAELTGVESVVHHMCVKSCIAYTGPFLDLDACPLCSEPRYDQFHYQISSGQEKVPCQEFHTIPIGPQLQALYRSPESASHTHYLHNEMSCIIACLDQTGGLDEYSDVLHGTDLIGVFQDGRINEDDIILIFLIDGAQLYAKKLSLC